MNNKFTSLAQANVDHYNDHPVTHTANAVIWLISGVIVIRWAAKRLKHEDKF